MKTLLSSYTDVNGLRCPFIMPNFFEFLKSVSKYSLLNSIKSHGAFTILHSSSSVTMHLDRNCLMKVELLGNSFNR